MPAKLPEYHLAATHCRPLIHNLFLNLAALVSHDYQYSKRMAHRRGQMNWASCIFGV